MGQVAQGGGRGISMRRAGQRGGSGSFVLARGFELCLHQEALKSHNVPNAMIRFPALLCNALKGSPSRISLRRNPWNL